MTVPGQSHRMRISTGECDYEYALQRLYLFGHGHERAGVYVERHLGYVPETQLSAGTTAEAKDLTSVRSQDHRVHIAARGKRQLVLLQGRDATRYRLVRVAIFVGRKT